MNIKQSLEHGIKILRENNIDEAILKTKILLSYALNKNKEYLITHEQEELTEKVINKYNSYITRIKNNEPIQYITQRQEFMGLSFLVNEDVLIPRPDTEILVEEVLNIIKVEQKNKVLDLCTGSGAIGISIAKYVQNAKVTLLDISNKALKVAKVNYINNILPVESSRIKIIKSNLFSEINEQNKFDIIVSNPPYIKTSVIYTLEKQVQKEPLIALDGGAQGLDIYKKIIKEAYKYLVDDGYLCLEIGYDQKEQIIKLIKNTKKYNNIYSKKDLAGNDRIVICKKEEN
ncbi:MAG: peptide chain release factor N(5)-glutamine methyltransferase [Clostridia bacterium]|nr:peptide chain release factor N(5)-glutamine methyltransferase [Clostridia bacterium]